MSQNLNQSDGVGEGFVDFQAIFASLRRGWLAIVLGGAISFLLGVLYLHVVTYTYTATLVLVPTQNQNQGGLGSQLGSLGSLVGLDIGNTQNVSPFILYPDVMKTRAASDVFAARYPNLMHELFDTQWDSSSNSWRAPAGTVHEIAAAVKDMLGYPPQQWIPPDGADVAVVLSTRVKIDLDRKKPILTVTFDHSDPVFARRFLQALHESTDLILRRQTLDRSTKYSHYLEQELKNEQQTELRQVLINSFNQQEMLVMMSSSDAPFAAQAVGGPISSMRPTNPRPLIVLLAAIIAGLFCGCIWSYFRGRRRSRALSL